VGGYNNDNQHEETSASSVASFSVNLARIKLQVAHTKLAAAQAKKKRLKKSGEDNFVETENKQNEIDYEAIIPTGLSHQYDNYGGQYFTSEDDVNYYLSSEGQYFYQASDGEYHPYESGEELT